MKKYLILLLTLLFVLGAASCKKTPEGTGSPSVSPSTSASPSGSPTTTATPGVIIGPSVTPTDTPADTPALYSSYANMVSFDPADGIAEFDYWDRLTGDAAVDWLVAEEGYTEAEAQALVDDFADSEFVFKNANHTLRSIDLSEVEVYLLDYPYGYEMAPDPDPILTSFADLCELYEEDPDILLEMNYYYITVDTGGVATEVAQCYQP